MWEVNFEGEVQSTHQFKQLLSTPPLPVINARSDPQYDPTPGPPQSLAFSRLLFVGEHSVVTWTDRGIYVFIPQNAQVLLWSPVRGIQDISVYRNELYCLHADGKISHFSLLPAERCVERLIRRSSWALAAKVCHLFQNAVISSKARKSLPIDKLEHLKAQLDLVIQQDLIRQLEEILAKLETMDSACSSRRSSVSSHESFNVLDCGIYRVISRRNSQSDEDSGSLHSQTLSEDERLREVCAPPEEEQTELDTVSHASVNMEGNRTEPILPFTISLPLRSTSPRMSLQAVRESVSSFVRKTSEKIGTLHMSPEIRRKLETREERPPDPSVSETPQPRDEKIGLEPPAPPQSSVEEVLLQELKSATREAMHKIQDPQVLFNASAMEEILQNWLAYLEKALNPQHRASVCQRLAAQEAAQSSGEEDGASLDAVITEDAIEEKSDVLPKSEGDPPFRLQAPCLLEEALHRDLAQLAMMCLAFRVFPGPAAADAEGGACRLMRTYFFLLDCKGLKRCILLNYKDAPSVWNTYIEGLKELSSGPESLAIENGDLVSTIQTLNSLEPWDSPVILAHVSRVYEEFGEAGARSLAKFYPSILPTDVAQFCRENPGHFLAYLDNLVKSKPEEQRLPLLQSLVQPESLKLDWLLLAVTHDAPHATNTVDPEGNPRPRSHLFTWGYGQLILLLIKLPSDFPTKEKMLSICKTSGYWPGYIALCLELDRRLEALAAIVYLDDLNLLDERNGLLPETMDEWKCLLHLAQNHVSDYQHHSTSNGEALSNGHSNWTKCITVENVALLLAKVIGPERALPYLQDWGASERFSDRYFKICEVMKVAERRQRALIQSMLERCEGFLWSQQV